MKIAEDQVLFFRMGQWPVWVIDEIREQVKDEGNNSDTSK
jgi:hypothetical protein